MCPYLPPSSLGSCTLGSCAPPGIHPVRTRGDGISGKPLIYPPKDRHRATSGRDLYGDLAAEPPPLGQVKFVAAPKAPRVVPTRSALGRQQAHGLVGDGEYLRAVGGLQRCVGCAPLRR